MADRTRDTWIELDPPYRTIVADPPWPYRDANSRSTTLQRGRTNSGRRKRAVSDLGYSTMDLSDISSLPVAELSADDAHLYLWTTNAFMYEAHDVARSWGFQPKTILTWVKVHQDEPGRPSMMAGYYFRGATEHVLFCVRGSLPLQTDEALPTAYLWPRIGAHSVKPDASLDVVEQASPGPYVELFCRRPRLGWDSWGYGYEVTS